MERLPNERKKGGGCARPYARDTIFPRFRSWRRLRKGHITKMIYDIRLLLFRLKRGLGGTQAGYSGKRWGGIPPTTNDQPRAVRNPMRDLMRDVKLMVPGCEGASAPLASSTRERRIRFASRTREPASRLLPFMARTPDFEAQFMFSILYPIRNPMRGTLISKDLDRRAASKRDHKGAPMRNPTRGAPFSQDLDRRDGFEKDTTRR